jgi:uncharacterized protein YciI
MNAQERVTELTQKMLRRKLYAIFGKTVVSPEELMPLLTAHLAYLIGLEKRGLLFASGPLTDVGAGPLGGGGLTVLRVANASEAREIAEAEPFAKNGLRTFEIKEWTIMEGTLGLRVNLSDQSVEVL